MALYYILVLVQFSSDCQWIVELLRVTVTALCTYKLTSAYAEK